VPAASSSTLPRGANASSAASSSATSASQRSCSPGSNA